MKNYVIRHGRRIEVETITPTAPARRRKRTRIKETWAKIPHHRGLKLAKQAKNSVLAVLLALESAVHEAHCNQVKLTNDQLNPYKISRQAKIRGLRQLITAEVVSVEWNGLGAPVVTHHWYTKQGKLRML
jgi:hypothetical protein